MSNYKETAVVNVPQEQFDYLKEDSGFGEHIVNHIYLELAKRIMDILDKEEEIIASQSELRVTEFMSTNSVEYRRQINWSPLVRCKDCRWFENDGYHTNCQIMRFCVEAEDYCSRGERIKDGKRDNS